MGKKSDNLEALVKEDFSKLSFYSQNDTLEVKPDCDNKSIYDLEYDAIHSCEDGSNVYYFNCCITIDLIERNAVWKNVRLNDEYHGKGWGGELIRAGESLFKKLGIQTAYVDTNVNKPFWESRGYKASFKILDNKGKKNFYQHVYETISSMSFYKGEDITISHDNKKCFFVSYSSGDWSYDSFNEKYISLELKINLKNKKVMWNGIQATNKVLKEIMVKFDNLFYKIKVK